MNLEEPQEQLLFSIRRELNEITGGAYAQSVAEITQMINDLIDVKIEEAGLSRKPPRKITRKEIEEMVGGSFEIVD